MNWYKKYKLAQLNGEYWIIDGKAVFADGDIIDQNHAAMVIEAIKDNYKDSKLGYFENYEDFERALYQEYCKKTGAYYHNESANPAEDDPDTFFEALKSIGMSEYEWGIIYGHRDPRPYGLMNLGWKRVHGKNIETYELKSNDIDAIRKGIYDILDQEGDYTTDENDVLVNIDVLSTRKFYSNVPLGSLLEGQIHSARLEPTTVP